VNVRSFLRLGVIALLTLGAVVDRIAAVVNDDVITLSEVPTGHSNEGGSQLRPR